MLQRVGLRDTLFIAMSNYYYEEKTAYLETLAASRIGGHDLTPFLKFSLKGIEVQCRRLFAEIRTELAKAVYRVTVTDLFGRLQSPRKRVISDRHVKLLYELLDSGDGIPFSVLPKRVLHLYKLQNPTKALVRDLNQLIGLGAISAERLEQHDFMLRANLDWPAQITETEFYRRIQEMPKAKTFGFLSS